MSRLFGSDFFAARHMMKPRTAVFAAALAVVAALVVFVENPGSSWLAGSRDPYYYDVRSYGAKGNGVVKDTVALQAAIDAAARHGGGVVLLPPGRYLSGTLHLRSNVSIRFAGGASLIASKDSADFDRYERPPAASLSTAKITWTLPARLRRALVLIDRSAYALKTVDDPDTTYAHYSLIVGDRVSNVTIDGSGTIDGNRTERGGPKLIALKNCRHITLRGLTLRNAPNYNISLIGTDDADLENLRIVNGYADGIDPDDSRFVRIANCYIDTWDDAICAKASFALGRRLATEDLVVTNCILRTSNNGFKFGTESEGDLRNVTFSNCLILRRSHGRAPITGVAIESVDGGAVDGVTISNVVMRGVRTPIFLRLGNRGRAMAVRYPGRIRDVTISDVVALNAANPSSIDGLPGFPIRDVTLANIDVQAAGGNSFVPAAVPELPQAYPQGEMFGVLPAYSLYARHVEGLTVSNWRERCARKDARIAVIFDDVSNLQMLGFHDGGTAAGSQPVILLRNVDRALIESVSSGRPGALLLQARGAGSREIVVASGDTRRDGGDGLELFRAGK
jgi:Glycosyl hydrolases family 28